MCVVLPTFAAVLHDLDVSTGGDAVVSTELIQNEIYKMKHAICNIIL